jgi:hypothetical protein
MSKQTGPAHWICDRCCCDGGAVNARETLPPGWLSMTVLVGVLQLQAEVQHVRRVHYCDRCAQDWLMRVLTVPSEDIEALRALWRR